MDISIIAAIIIGTLFIIILVAVIIKNRKDRRDLEEQLNQDYKKPREGDEDEDRKV